MARAFMVLFVLGFLPVLSSAEEQDAERGRRVRVTTTTGERLTGRLGGSTSGAIVVELDDARGSRSVPVTDVTGLETRSSRTRSRGAWSKAKWGALIGAASGTTLGFHHEEVGEDGTSVAGAVALGVWSGGVMGGLIGAVIGAVSPGEEWVKVNPRVQLSGKHSGISLSVTFEF